jgi:hypothetical protein
LLSEVEPRHNDDDLQAASAQVDIFDAVLDAILGGPDVLPEPSIYDVYLQGADISLTIAPVRIRVEVAQKLAKQFLPASPPTAASGSKKTKPLVRFQLCVLQPEFEFNQGVSLVCERFLAGNGLFSLGGTQEAVTERLDASFHTVSVHKEGAEHLLPLIDPPLLECRLRLVDRRVLVSLSDLELNMDPEQAQGLLGMFKQPSDGVGSKSSSGSEWQIQIEVSRITCVFFRLLRCDLYDVIHAV